MRFYLDTEFNGFGGELISIALVGADGSEFYEVAEIKAPFGAWVAEHVVPRLGKASVPVAEVQKRLHRFLDGGLECEFVADWPCDFKHLCSLLAYPMGKSIPFSLFTFRLLQSGPTNPADPHNALSDARALRDIFEKQ